MALEQDRQVFAVMPDSPLSGKAHGSNRLPKEGATLVQCVEDVIEEPAPLLVMKEVNEARPQPAASNQGDETKKTVSAIPQLSEINESNAVLDMLKHDKSLHVNSIIEGSGLKPRNVLRLLLELELRGLVAQHSGKLFSLA